MSEQPTIKRMVMFKHGVAFVERSGPADGPFELSFKRDEMNDVLKSLTVWVAEGDATLGAIAFEKPEDPERALEERRLNFHDGGALTGLLAALRGRSVSLRVHGKVELGELVGVERFAGADHALRATVVLRRADGSLGMFDLLQVEAVELHDERSRADIAYVLDRNRAATAGETRFVRVDLRGKSTDVRVSYVVPAPTWRVSYRIAIEKEEVTVMGFGIIHNPADENLENVQLTLTTGQPVSFVIDLYNPKTIERTVVQEASRKADAPVQYARAAAMPAPAMIRSAMGAPPPQAMQMASMHSAFDSDSEVADRARNYKAMRMSDAADQMVSASEGAEGAERGEFFEYRVRTPISLRRGGSAMVPLFSARGPAKKERIWRGRGEHPDMVLTLNNFTGAVLEEGPAVLYDDDVYAGESMMPYSTRGSVIRLGFAKDLGVRCSVRSTLKTVAVSVVLKPKLMLEEYRTERTITFTVESDHDEPIIVLYERAKASEHGVTIVDAVPIEATATFHRFRVEAAGKGRTELVFKEIWRTYDRVEVGGVDRKRVRNWFDSKFLDQAALDELQHTFEISDRMQDHRKNQRSWEQRRRAIFDRVGNITNQLNVLKDSGPEGELRLRFVQELGESQTEIKRCESSEAEFHRMYLIAGAELEAALANLGQGPLPTDPAAVAARAASAAKAVAEAAVEAADAEAAAGPNTPVSRFSGP